MSDGLHRSWTGQEPADIEVVRLRSELDQARAEIRVMDGERLALNEGAIIRAERESALRVELDQARATIADAQAAVVHWMDQTLRERANSDRLAEALAEAKVNLHDWGQYAGDYFIEKWDLQGDVDACEPALAAHRVLRGEVRERTSTETYDPTACPTCRGVHFATCKNPHHVSGIRERTDEGPSRMVEVTVEREGQAVVYEVLRDDAPTEELTT